MKQSKPYGRHVGSREPRALTITTTDATAAPSKAAWNERGSIPDKEPRRTALRVQPQQQKPGLGTMTFRLLLLLAAIYGFIAVRDSVFVQNLIMLTSNTKANMICIDGEVRYEDWSLWKRLVGNGEFLCTDWKAHKKSNRFPFL